REDKITQFQLCVYTVVADIPKGRVSTYTAIARILECSPRAVRLALKRNPFALEVPCHRVIASNMHVDGCHGDETPLFAQESVVRKLDLLATEGVFFDHTGSLLDITRLMNESDL
ncbi:hypothetical protein M433DRAFT_55668, partial [Acidomyces richmondensis BFW]